VRVASLAALGIKVAASTVWEILKEHGIRPAPEREGTTWADFLRSQAKALLACDLFETRTLTGARLYVFAVIEHSSPSWTGSCTPISCRSRTAGSSPPRCGTTGTRTWESPPTVGVTTDGRPVPDLYTPKDTGISAGKAAEVACAYLDTLERYQRVVARLPMDSPDWRLWTNALPVWTPKGMRLERLTAAQREAALAVMEASLSPEGFHVVRSAMKLNGALGEYIDDYRDTLREFAYHFTVFGDPATLEPWDWQLMGHHVDVHCVFVGTQVVLAPVFLGAEPAVAQGTRYAGVRALDEETDRGLALRRALSPDQEDLFLQGDSLLAADLPPELAGPSCANPTATTTVVGGLGADSALLQGTGAVPPPRAGSSTHRVPTGRRGVPGPGPVDRQSLRPRPARRHPHRPRPRQRGSEHDRDAHAGAGAGPQDGQGVRAASGPLPGRPRSRRRPRRRHPMDQRGAGGEGDSAHKARRATRRQSKEGNSAHRRPDPGYH
jgi:hypothetical protein